MVAFFYIVRLVFLVSEEEGASIECGLAPAPVIFPHLLTEEYLFLFFTQLFLRGNGLYFFTNHKIFLHSDLRHLHFNVLLSFLIANFGTEGLPLGVEQL